MATVASTPDWFTSDLGLQRLALVRLALASSPEHLQLLTRALAPLGNKDAIYGTGLRQPPSESSCEPSDSPPDVAGLEAWYASQARAPAVQRRFLQQLIAAADHTTLTHLRRACVAAVEAPGDLLGRLPAPLAQRVLQFLPGADLARAQSVCRHWRTLGQAVAHARKSRQQAGDFVLDLHSMQAECAPSLVRIIPVPHAAPGAPPSFGEERNVFCGFFSVLSLEDPGTEHRVVSLSQNLIASGGSDKVITLRSRLSGQKVGTISGPAGSIKAIHLDEEAGHLYAASFDTSVRKWDLASRKCLFVCTPAHTASVTCLAAAPRGLVSGSKDRTVRLWHSDSGAPLATIKLSSPVTCLASDATEHCLAGTECGKGVEFTDWAVRARHFSAQGFRDLNLVCVEDTLFLTAGTDMCVQLWRARGDETALATFRHPSEVLVVRYANFRVISGAADGKIRIWDMTTSQCIKIFRGNSLLHAVTGLAFQDRTALLVNTATSMHLLNFAKVETDATDATDATDGDTGANTRPKTPTRLVSSSSPVKLTASKSSSSLAPPTSPRIKFGLCQKKTFS